MDLFRKGTLKSQSLNSRFLSANNPNHGQQPLTPSQTLSSQLRSLPLQPLESSAHNPPPPLSHQSSKLKLTTTRQSSALRLNREQNASPSATTTTPEPGTAASSNSTNVAVKDVAPDKKLPVWSKAVPVLKPTKSYTDEELKAMHGISLVSRNSAPGEKRENRWDDSDEDDDWGDTIDFGDGTKVIIGQSDKLDLTTPINDERPATADVEDKLPPISLPPLRDLKDPWKASESGSIRTPDLHEYPDVATSRQLTTAQHDRLPSSSHDDAHMSRSAYVDIEQGRRPRSDSFNRDGRMHSSGDARYQYDQNTFDRRWHNPPPSTREIYDPTTGKLEQIDSTQRPARRSFHNERKPTELLQRSNQDSTRANKSTDAQTNGKHEEVAGSKASLDPSSKEFTEMQKTLMSTARELAIKRRKDQEAEDAARKERARKKAADLAALAEKEAAEKEAQQKAKLEAKKAKEVERVNARYGTAEKKDEKALVANEKKSGDDKWQRGTKLLPRSEKLAPVPQTTADPPQTPGGTFAQEPAVSNRPVWGPIGPKPIEGGSSAKQSSKSRSSEDETHKSSTGDLSESLNRTKGTTSSSWSAFDGIGKIGPQPREYNVYDAADEPLTPERHPKQSPMASQTQPNRTSSRFFPSAAAMSSTQQPAKPLEAKQVNGSFISPLLPPRIDMPDHVFYDIYKSAMSLQLPPPGVLNVLDRTAKQEKSHDQVISAIRTAAKPLSRQKYPRLETQTRSVWEVKAQKDGLKPRVRVPQAERALEWTRQEATTKTSEPDASGAATPKVPFTHALPLQAPWIMPETLEITSRTSSVQEPLVPPSPALNLPKTPSSVSTEVSPQKRKPHSRNEQERYGKYYTTRTTLLDEVDNMSPIRIKIANQDATKIPRKFGKRAVENANGNKKSADIKRQPINMSDAPQDAQNKEASGFKRGFANRVRKAPPGLESPVILRRDNGHDIASALAPQGPPGITLPVRNMQ